MPTITNSPSNNIRMEREIIDIGFDTIDSNTGSRFQQSLKRGSGY
jgi:hypothetical protein